MKYQFNWRRIILGGALLGSLGRPDALAAIGSTSDIWDVSAGITILNNSPTDDALGVPGSIDIRDMFGGQFGAYLPERGFTTFTDGVSAGTIQFVEWRTSGLIQLNSFTLYASGDGPDFGNQREFGNFTLKVKSPGSLVFDLTLFSYNPLHPYSTDTAGDSSFGPSFLKLDVTLPTPIQGDEFRAEFTNLGDLSSPGCCGGPRILELDGFGTAVIPEGSAARFCGLGFLAMILVRWLRRRIF